MTNINIGKNILDARKRLGLTQEELAARVGYKSKASINKIELGVRDLPQRKIALFARALEVSPGQLMGWDDGPTTTRASVELVADDTAGGDTTMGDVIKSLRVAKKLTLSEFSEELGITLDDMQKYENGSKQLSAKNLAIIAHYFGLESEDITHRLINSSGLWTGKLQLQENYVERLQKWTQEFGFDAFTKEERNQLFQYARFLIWQRENK